MSRLLRVPFVVILEHGDTVPTACRNCESERLAWSPMATWTAPPVVQAVLTCVDCSETLLVRDVAELPPLGDGAADGRLEVIAAVEPGDEGRELARVRVGAVEIVAHESLVQPGAVNVQIDRDDDGPGLTVHINDGLMYGAPRRDPLEALVRVTEELGLYDQDPPPPCRHGRAQPCRECARTTSKEA